MRKNELSINAGYMTTKLAPEQQAEISQRIENGENPAHVVSEVRKRNTTNKDRTCKAVTVQLTLEEYEKAKVLARANNTDIDSMITNLVRKSLSTHTNTR